MSSAEELVLFQSYLGGGHCQTLLLLLVSKKYHRIWLLDQTHIQPTGNSTSGFLSLLVYSSGLGGGGAGRFPGGGGGPFLGGGGLLPPTLPPEVVASSLAGFGTLGGAGSFLPSSLGGGGAPSEEGLRRLAMFGRGLEGAKLKEGRLSREGGLGGGRGGGGLLADEPLGGGTGVGGLGDLSGGGGGLGEDPGVPLPGLDLSLGGATGGVVGVEGKAGLLSLAFDL